MKIPHFYLFSLFLILNLNLFAQDGPYLFGLFGGKILSIKTDLNNTLFTDTLYAQKTVEVQIPGSTEFFTVNTDPVQDQKQYEFPSPEKLFAVSDIEGNYNDLVTILRNNGIINKDLKWVFGKGHLVLNGDMVDRGEFVTQVLWLICKLETEAEKSGGKVHYLLGNHDVMLMQGDDRYAADKYKLLAEKTGRKLKDFFGPRTYFGRWMRSRNIVEKIGGTIFVHGGLNGELLKSDLSIAEINELALKNIDVPDSLLNEEADLIFGSWGPLWYRGLITDQKKYAKISLPELDKVLAYYNADRIVVGHCVMDDVSEDFGGKVIRIDVDHYTAESSGIYIEKNVIYKAMKSGKRIKLR